MDKKLKESEILEFLKEDLKAATPLHNEAVGKVKEWRKQYKGEPYGNEQDGKSKIVSRDIRRADEWQHAAIKDPFVSGPNIVSMSPVTFEDKPLAEQNEVVLNYQFTRQFNRYKFITDVAKLYNQDGTIIVKTSWEYEDKVEKVKIPVTEVNPFTGEIVIVGEKLIDDITVIVNKPSAQVCRLEDIYVDPTCLGDLDKAQFVIHEYETDLSTLRKAKKYKNLEKVAKKLSQGISDTSFDPNDDTGFVFRDVARKKVVVREYWGNFDVDNDGVAEPVVFSWVEDTIIQARENPLPDKKIPFILVGNGVEPFGIYGEGYAELIGDNQKLSTAIKRGVIDNMANSNNGQVGIPIDAFPDRLNRKRFLNGQRFEFRGNKGNFYQGSYNQLPSSVFHMLDLINNDSESLSGSKSFAGGITGTGLGSTATSARGALDAASVRQLDIIRNISENLIKKLIRKWMAYNSEFLSPEEVTRITNKPFVPYKDLDVEGAIDVHIEVSTAEDMSSKASQIAYVFQTAAQFVDEGVRNMAIAEFFRLNRLPDLAEAIKNYEPTPDPVQQRIKELELLKLEAEIRERNSRTSENEVDKRVKETAAQLNIAKTQSLKSDADLKDLEFTDRASGIQFEERMLEKDHDRDSAILKQSPSLANSLGL